MVSGTVTAGRAEKLSSMLKRRGFVWPSFEIYGGQAGFYDYGPLGLLLRENIKEIWRRIYRAEGFFEIDTPCINPEAVFRASGHLKSFSDVMVECRNCHDAFRADHLITTDIGSLAPQALGELIKSDGVKCPRCGAADFTEPVPFNLMFETHIGPSKGRSAYLRPETPQGIFINYQHLSRFYREKLPFGILQTGKAFRNEISPRQGLLRLREFNIMEAEVFLDPEEKKWHSAEPVSRRKVHFLSRDGKTHSIFFRDAVGAGLLKSDAHAYFMGLTYNFAIAIGLDTARLRYRQHTKDELAHYALDCWDLEALLSSGWTEVTGVADRGDFDLKSHSTTSGVELSHFRKGGSVHIEKIIRVKADRAKLGPLFRKDSGTVAEKLEAMDASSVRGLDSVNVEINGRSIEVSNTCYSVEEREERVSGKRVVPHVIEPASGLDRLFFALLEHSFDDSDGRTVLHLTPAVAPIKAAVLPLISDIRLDRAARALCARLNSAGLESYYDDTASIGRRYARMDEAGTPYCITVDSEWKDGGTVTVRDRDTRKQIRVPEKSVESVISRLIAGENMEKLGEPVVMNDEETVDGENDE